MAADNSDETLLYKFRSLATEQDITFAADIILNHRLFAASPKSFNDPFDCDAPYCFDATDGEKIARAVQRIKKENPHVSDEEARRLAPSRYSAAETDGFAKIRSFVETQMGVVSMAATIENPLLWGHYASGHTGISIQFRAWDVRHVDFFGRAMRVAYQRERPLINFYRDDLHDQLQKSVLTKSQDWAYEKERRILVKDRQNQCYVSFDPSMIDAIYLGCRANDGQRAHVREWISRRGKSAMPRLFQAHKSETRYELFFEEISAVNNT